MKLALHKEDLRDEILDLCEIFFEEQRNKKAFIPGVHPVSVSGKVLDGFDLRKLVNSCLDLWLTSGKNAHAFESGLASTLGVKRAALTTSGSSANLLAISALTSFHLGERALQKGDEIITVAAGFPTTIAPIIQNGCIPVFVDVELETANIDVSILEGAITPKTKGIILAHTLGNPFNLDVVMALAKAHNLYVIEDCCDALGATYRDQSVGSFGDLATLSFYPAHHITTGEGGAVLSRRTSLAKIVESFRDWGRDCWCETGCDNTCGQRFNRQMGNLPHGYDHKYIYTHLGYNLKMTDMQAALGVSQLQNIDRFVKKRRENFGFLTKAFQSEGLDAYFHLPKATPHSNPSWFGFLLTLRDNLPFSRRALISHLEEYKIGTRLLFAGNMTKQPALSREHYRIFGNLHITDKIMNDSFWIGVWPGLDQTHLSYAVQKIADFFKRN